MLTLYRAFDSYVVLTVRAGHSILQALHYRIKRLGRYCTKSNLRPFFIGSNLNNVLFHDIIQMYKGP